MKIVNIGQNEQNKYVPKFSTKEELKIYCSFLYYNDYFLRKNFTTLLEYTNYFEENLETIYIDCEYHIKLSFEILNTIDNYKRITKLNHLNNIF